MKERSPADVTFYAGYSNGCISYMPTASEYPLGGYEPAYGHKTYGLPAQVAPETERLLVETGVRLVRSLFPERAAAGGRGLAGDRRAARPARSRAPRAPATAGCRWPLRSPCVQVRQA